jgi:hypothetical protein
MEMKEMSMKYTLLSATLVCIFLTSCLTGCSKEGLDGTSSVSGTVAHHGEVISNALVYIKFGATELPGTNASDFDASVMANTQGVYLVENLQSGNYYFYGVGYDSTISQVVKGGIKVTIDKDEDLTVPLAVTED